MRTTIYLCCLLVLIFSQAAQASFNPHNSPRLLIDYTKAKSNLVRSESPYTKYALVRFILDKGDDFSHLGGSDNGNSSTPNLTQTPDAGCTAAAYPYTTDVTAQNCASTSQCFDGTTYRMKCTSCKSNMGLSGGKCTCAAGGYKYSDNDGDNNKCPAPSEFDLNTSNPTCSEVGSDGKTKLYYKSCVCPSTYQYTCTSTGQKGVGTSCSVNGETAKYAECSCGSPYSLTCDTADVNPSGTACYDTLTKKNYYANCTSVCDINKGEILSWNDWWCGLCINQ